MLDVKNVTKKYGDLVAVSNLSFHIEPGEIFGLLGLNGAGKTTTFRMILNLFTPDEGVVLYKGEPIGYEHADEVGFLSEERSLLTKMTVREQILYYGRLKGKTSEEIVTSLKYWLNRFSISEYETKKIKELSKGNQQKIQFISAIVHDPKLLILDEPFTGLDPLNVELFKDVIMEFKEQGKAIIFSSHRMEHVEQFCEKLVILVKGKSILAGDLQEIKESFHQKNIYIKGDINPEELLQLPGVLEVTKENGEFEVKIQDDTFIQSTFDSVKTKNNITLFDVRLPSLNEIFIAKVGERYEQ